ncbi:PaaX family transcriptional regulator [Spiractinospora alimapuensis]|uniref:PaaX family transcriptional regulator n=1 Tax=Spiractinospora alimapuensis TaxID=2820884 RepID=UPI001F20FB74|nr:PaaX family transcriptional regulator C-terminal domain-containing protein [Spiractinospora alimapuensis]QVQ50270.1 PaaX family transcriptional regulator [Spiractinospora alimapuensis]
MTTAARGQHPPSRRPIADRQPRRIGDPSARALLLTILGELVVPTGEPAWTTALVQALGRVGVEEKSARQALARAGGAGWLVSERSGRRVRWQVTEPGRRLLTEGARRIYTFGHREHAWDRRWLVLLVSVPEPQREARHRLRKRLTWAGLGSPAPGVWVTPNADREAEVHAVLRELGLDAEATSFVATYGAIGEELDLVSRAWDLTGVAKEYEEFISAFRDVDPRCDEDVFARQIRLVDAWRRFPFLDPRLPADLLPTGWRGEEAAALFDTRHRRWAAATRRVWEALAAG